MTARRRTQKKPECYIFGAGNGGIRSFRYYRRRFRVVGFLDNDSSKVGGRVCGIPVFDPRHLSLEHRRTIVVGSQYSDQICQQLLSVGVSGSDIIVANSEILNGEYETPMSAMVIFVLVLAILALAIIGCVFVIGSLLGFS